MESKTEFALLKPQYKTPASLPACLSASEHSSLQENTLFFNPSVNTVKGNSKIHLRLQYIKKASNWIFNSTILPAATSTPVM